MQSKLNQAITLHPLFFDPVNKKALLMKKNGKEFCMALNSYKF